MTSPPIHRKRQAYTPRERAEFVKIAKKYEDIINKRSNLYEHLQKRNMIWDRIACEFNTSPIQPYPATSKQLRRLWTNMKQNRNNSTSVQESAESWDDDCSNDEITKNDNAEESSTRETPAFTVEYLDSYEEKPTLNATDKKVNKTKDSILVKEIFKGQNSEDTFEEGGESNDGIEGNNTKEELLMKEYQDRRRRQNEIHMLQKRLMNEKIREARARADLAELELAQRQA